MKKKLWSKSRDIISLRSLNRGRVTKYTKVTHVYRRGEGEVQRMGGDGNVAV